MKLIVKKQLYGSGCEWLLTVLWTVGILCGAVWTWENHGAWSGILSEAVGLRISLLSALEIAVFPMLVSLSLSVLLGTWSIWLLCPVRAFLLGSVSAAVGLCWGSGAAVAAVLLLFSVLATAPLLLLLWQQLRLNHTGVLSREAAVLTGIAAVIAAIDYWIISPFLVEVINL